MPLKAMISSPICSVLPVLISLQKVSRPSGRSTVWITVSSGPMGAARVKAMSLYRRLSGTGLTHGSSTWMQPVSVCMPTFSPAAWSLSVTCLRPSRPWGYRPGLGS